MTNNYNSSIADEDRFLTNFYEASRSDDNPYDPFSVCKCTSPSPIWFFSVVIDSFNIEKLYETIHTDSSFFQQIQQQTPTRLISHFAQCEINKESFTNPEKNLTNQEIEILIQKEESTFFHNQKQKTCILQRYRLFGNQNTFKTIYALDPHFFLTVFEFCQQQQYGYYIARIDLQYSTTEDLMPFISLNIAQGRISSNKIKPYVIGTFANSPVSGSLGRQSALYQQIKQKKQELKVDTLYVGSHKKSPVSITLYNKKKAQLEKFGDLSSRNSCVEVRVNCRIQKPDSEFFINLLHNYDQPIGLAWRTHYFLTLLNQNLAFTIVQRVPLKKSYLDQSKRQIAPWWNKLVLLPNDFFLNKAQHSYESENS